MFLTIMPNIFDIRVLTIMSIAGWAILFIFIGCMLIIKAEQLEQDEETLNPERKSDE